MTGFEFYKDKGGEWRWRLLDNGRTIADSAEGYEREEGSRHGAEVFTKHAPNTPVRIVEDPSHKNSGEGYDWECFLDKDKKWRWHFQANNNKIIADSGNLTAATPDVIQSNVEQVKAVLRVLAGQPGTTGTISLTVIVSGTPTDVVAAPPELLQEIALRALQQTGNTARPLTDWTLKTRAGEMLDLNRSVASYNLADREQLVLSLEAGVGGDK